MGSYNSGFKYRKTIKSIALVSIVASLVLLPSLPLNIAADDVSISVDTDKTTYFLGETMFISGFANMAGEPLGDTQVNLTIRGPPDYEVVWSDDAFTEDNGFYSLEAEIPTDTPLGEYNVTAVIYGYIPPAADSVWIEVIEEVQKEVTVVVRGPGDTPIANASVILYEHLTDRYIDDDLTNATGVAAMTAPTAISFDVLIHKTGYGENVSGEVRGFLFDNNGSLGYASPCELDFSLASADYGVLSGTVVNATDNAALEGADVSISAYVKGKTYWVNSTTTLSDGSYSANLNVGLWRIWIDRRVDGDKTHLGTWSAISMTADASATWNASLWPRARLSIEGVWADGSLVDHGTVVLINDTYDGLLWRADFSLPPHLPQGESSYVNLDMPAANGLLLVMYQNDKRYVYSTTINPSAGSTVTLNATLSENQYELWSFPNDWQSDRLLGNLTMVTMVVDPETAIYGFPEFMDPDGVLYQYLMFDRGYELPTTWRTYGMPTRTDVGSFYQFFDLDALGAPEGYYMCIALVKNSTGHVIAAEHQWFNRFQYQVQPLQVKGTYDVGEDVDIRFKVYGASGYTADVEVTYGLVEAGFGWRFVRGGSATVNSTTKVWNVTLPSEILSPTEYNLGVRVSGGREETFMFVVQEHTPITFRGYILQNASMDLWSEQYHSSVVTADETGLFNVSLPPAEYDAWFFYDNKDTPGMDGRDTWMRLSLYNDIFDFPNEPGFEEYQWRPMQTAFELRGIAFYDANGNGVLDDGEDRLAEVNVRAANMSGWEEWGPATFPDGSYRFFLRPDETYRLKATKSIYTQNETAISEVGAGTSQGDLLVVNIPMVPQLSGNITGYVMLDNGTLLEDAEVNFMDEYWSWLGNTFTNSSGGYLFTAPANKKLNIWVHPPHEGGMGIGGKDVPGVMVGEDQTLYLNITLCRQTRINGTIQLNGVDVWAQIMPLDEDWNRVSWDWGESGHFECDVPTSVKKLLIWSWGSGFLIEDVDLQVGVTNDLGLLNLVPMDTNVTVDAHPMNWEWEWSVGQYLNFTVELRDQQNDWQPISGANVTFWAWHWDNGTLVGQGTVTESDPIMAPGIYEESFLLSSGGHYKVFVVANVTGNRVSFTDFWVCATDKKLLVLESSGEYVLADVQDGNAKITVKLFKTADGSLISGYDVWYEIRGFTDIETWQMETVVTRTPATDLGTGVYKVTLPSILDAGEYWMEIVAGDWESSQHLGFWVAENVSTKVNIYGWVTIDQTPAEGATVEAWMEAMPYNYLASTNASGYYSLPVPEKHAYHLHIFWDNATTTGVDYTTVPEWERIEVKAVDILHNATVSCIEEVSLTLMQEDEQGIPRPVNAEVLVWDLSETPPRLMMWAGTWMGEGLFKEKLAEGRYVFEIRSWSWPPWCYWTEPKNVSAEPPPDSWDITVPAYDAVQETWVNTLVNGSNVWRVRPGDIVTIQLMEFDISSQLQPPYNDIEYVMNNCENKFEVFHWVPGRMAEAYAYNVTWMLRETEMDRMLEANFTVPSYFAGGEFELQIAFYNTSEQAENTVFIMAHCHLTIAPLDLGLTVVPWSASVNETVIAVAVVMSEGSPAVGANVQFEIYDDMWQTVTIEAAEELMPGVYAASFTIPDGYQCGWWTIKAIVTLGAKEAEAYEGIEVSGGATWYEEKYPGPPPEEEGKFIPAKLTGVITDSGVDTDDDGLFNYLEIGVEVHVAEPGDYVVEIDGLLDGDYGYIEVNGSQSAYLEVGDQVVNVSLTGPDIYDSGLNPVYVDQISLYDGDWVLLDDHPEPPLSREYSYTEFQPE